MSMVPEGNRQTNIDRFSGFEDTYDQFRPEAPRQVIGILTEYLQHRPDLVLDLGCGTGLSTLVWRDQADRIIGIEPNDDMRGKAQAKLQEIDNHQHISFIPGFSNKLSFSDSTVDIITCSQSFHWMEPTSTLQEAARVLRDGGVFAAYDCDWPPTVNWQVEDAYEKLIAQTDDIIKKNVQHQDQAVKRNKESHLTRIRESGLFRFSKEIVFHNYETCDAERYAGLAISQGGIQTVFRLGISEMNGDIEKFKQKVEAHFHGRTLQLMFSYRMRLGIK